MTSRRVALAAFVAVLSLAALAPAQGARPVPGCAGLSIEDPPGDVSALAGPTADNLDITGAFFVTDAKGALTANLQIANMSTLPPPPATAASWYVIWRVGNVRHYVTVEADVAGQIVYEYGTYEEDETTGGSYVPVGPTTGQIFEGENGLISIAAPKAAQGQVGKILTETAANSYQLVQNGLGGGVLLFGDDAGPGTDYTVGGCELGAGGTPNPPAGPPLPKPPASQPAPKLPLTLVTKTAKVSRGRLALKVKASEAVTQLAARLRRGKKVVATGKLTKVAGGATATLKLKVKGRPKRGRYTLDVTARRADGRLASKAFSMKLG